MIVCATATYKHHDLATLAVPEPMGKLFFHATKRGFFLPPNYHESASRVSENPKAPLQPPGARATCDQSHLMGFWLYGAKKHHRSLAKDRTPRFARRTEQKIS